MGTTSCGRSLGNLASRPLPRQSPIPLPIAPRRVEGVGKCFANKGERHEEGLLRKRTRTNPRLRGVPMPFFRVFFGLGGRFLPIFSKFRKFLDDFLAFCRFFGKFRQISANFSRFQSLFGHLPAKMPSPLPARSPFALSIPRAGFPGRPFRSLPGPARPFRRLRRCFLARFSRKTLSFAASPLGNFAHREAPRLRQIWNRNLPPVRRQLSRQKHAKRHNGGRTIPFPSGH